MIRDAAQYLTEPVKRLDVIDIVSAQKGVHYFSILDAFM